MRPALFRHLAHQSRALCVAAVAGIVLLAAQPGLAEDAPAVPSARPGANPPISIEEFDAHVIGRTLTYSQYGQIYGIEEYLPGRKVRWKFAEDLCQYGSWHAKGDLICFSYEYDQTEHCWQFWREGDGLKALSTTDQPGDELSEVAQSDRGLNCAGPDVGV